MDTNLSPDDKQNWKSTRSARKGPPKACLFAANIPLGTGEQTLQDVFSQYGDIAKVTIPKNNPNVAFIQYIAVESADKALSAIIIIGGKKLRLERSKANSTLFIARMSYSLSSDELKKICERFGPVEKVSIITNYKTKTSKGCGFVKFIYREDALACLVHAQQNPSFGECNQKWVVEWALSTEEQMNTQTIFIGGLNKAIITEDQLNEKFQVYGKIEKISLINNVDDESPAYAFIQYIKQDSAANAIKNEDGKEWLDETIRVQYSESLETKTKKRNLVLESMAPYLVQLPPNFSPAYSARPSSEYVMMAPQANGIPKQKGTRSKKSDPKPYMVQPPQGMYPVFFTMPTVPFFPSTQKQDSVLMKDNPNITPSSVPHAIAVE